MSDDKTIDRATVQHVAKLSRIALSEKELDVYSKQLAGILDYIGKLNKLDIFATSPTSHPIKGLKNVFREDIAKESISTEAALKNAPKTKGSFFSVPKIIE